jgi:hypothetical protein
VLPEIQALGAGSIQGGNRRNSRDTAGKPRKNTRGSNFTREAKLKSDIRDPVMIVVDLHLVENAWIKREIVGTIARLQKRIHV